MNFDNIIQVFLRLKSLLDQYDSAEKHLADMEMQREVLSRIGKNSDELLQAKGMTSDGIKSITEQRDAAKRTIEDFTGSPPSHLRDKVSEIGVLIEQYSSTSMEEKKIRAAFELLVEMGSFGEDEGETRADYEQRVSFAKKAVEVSARLLAKHTHGCLNRKSIIVPIDSVLKKIWSENPEVATSNLITI
jgi:arginyl-tRNA synthetase